MTKRDPNDWMWERAAELLERTAWVQRRFFQVAQGPGSVWEPPVDVFESGEELFVLVALPGVDPQGIEVRWDGDALVISARRALPSACGGAQVRRLEIPQGRFQRRVPLGIAAATIEARSSEHGVLLVRLRKGS
jgi:HSP20 family protein